MIILRNASVPHDAPLPAWGDTPWYDGHQMPLQIGVYKRLSVGAVVMYSFFDGAHWLWNMRTPELAVRVAGNELSICQTLPWAGLTMPPPQGYGPVDVPAAATATAADSEGGDL